MTRGRADEHLLDNPTIQRILGGHQLKRRQRHLRAVRSCARPAQGDLPAASTTSLGTVPACEALTLRLMLINRLRQGCGGPPKLHAKTEGLRLPRACYTSTMSHMRRPVVLLSLGVVALLLIQSPLGAQATGASTVEAAARQVDRSQLMRDLEILAAPAFEGRRTGTPGALKARQWLVDQFRAIGLTPAGTEEYLQPFTFSTRDTRAVLPGGRPFTTDYSAANVIGRLSGRETRARLLVVTAHYDHLGIRDGVLFPGADDNASGVAVLLAAARHFVRNPPRHPIMFAAFDAEELGLRGARALADSALLSRSAVAMNINLDMVSRNDRNEIYAAGTSHAPWLRPLLQDVQTRASVNIRFGHDRPMERGGGGLEDWTQSSDHGPFHDAGIPFVYFGVEDHPDYHKPTDTAGRVDSRFFGDAADMIIEALGMIDLRVD